jgi:hypothetical protein
MGKKKKKKTPGTLLADPNNITLWLRNKQFKKCSLFFLFIYFFLTKVIGKLGEN